MSQAEMYAENPYAQFGRSVAAAPIDVRASFIRKTYMHLAAAVYAFVALEWFLFSIGMDQKFMEVLGQSQYSWLIVLAMFIGVSWIAERWATSTTSIGMQYVGLVLYVIAQAIIFLPLLSMAKGASVNFLGPDIGVIPAAAVTTLIMFGGLTAVAFLSKADFTFMGGFLKLTMFAALALIVASIFIGFNLGVWFSALMIIAACGYILYDTSAIMYRFNTEQHVAAALALFASVALLFWYVVRLFLAFSSRD